MKAALLISQVVAKDMIEKKVEGSIVNISSQASSISLPLHTSYAASKGALDQLTRMMALELGKEKIRVNSVNPTVVLTDMGIENWSDPKKAQPMLDKIPLGVKETFNSRKNFSLILIDFGTEICRPY